MGKNNEIQLHKMILKFKKGGHTITLEKIGRFGSLQGLEGYIDPVKLEAMLIGNGYEYKRGNARIWEMEATK